MRAIAVVASLVALQFAAIAFAVVGVAYDLRVQHDAARAPTRSAELRQGVSDERSRAAFSITERFDQLSDGMQFSVMLLDPPRDPAATPPPPGGGSMAAAGRGVPLAAVVG